MTRANVNDKAGITTSKQVDVHDVSNTSNDGTNASNDVIIHHDKEKDSDKTSRKCCRFGPRYWCKKYFWEGQELMKPPPPDYSHLSRSKRFLAKHRRLIGFCVPGIAFHFFWWSYFIQNDLWHLFAEKYVMSLTMIFGSLVAGMTSEGGGAVAFPVMTLALNLSPSIARDFALMVQSCGMSCASFTIFFMRVRIEWHSLICCSIGGIFGNVLGLYYVDPYLSPSAKKLGFVSIWFAFASVLIILNRTTKRRTFNTIVDFKPWKAVLLVVFGFIGGVFTSFAGSGIDICSFMVLTLLFRISEKVATPTSVILMAFNSLIGFYWRGVIFRAITRTAYEYILVCSPIVVFGAPVGSLLGTHFHRLVLAALVIAIDTVALIGGFALVRPLTPIMIGVCVAIVVVCFCMFLGLTFAGQKMLDNIEKRENQTDHKLALDQSDWNEPETNGHVNHAHVLDEDVENPELTSL